MTDKPKFDNPIVEIYRGHSIRKYEMIRARIPTHLKKKIIDGKLDFGLSESDMIQKLLCPCNGVEIKKSVYHGQAR